MPRYVSLVRFTDQGIQAIKDGPERLAQARHDFEATGAKIIDFYLTLGRYDAVAVIEAPDDATMAQLSLSVAARGNSRSETLRAFDEEGYREIVASLR